jgi:hypothetical protein
MTRKFKTLGVALFAVLALTAVSASAASAVSYTAGAYPTTGTGESAVGNDTFTTEAGNVECKSHFEGTLAAPSTSLTVKAKYSSCRAFGFLEGTVAMNSCDYLFTEPKLIKTHEYTASVHVKCTNPASPITITAATCKATVGEQSPGGHVIITNDTVAGDVKVRATVTGINYTVVTDGFGCPFAGTGAKTGATYLQHNEITFDSTNGQTIDVG